jgi:ATP-dependent Lon protease
MRESAQTALTFLKTEAHVLHIAEQLFVDQDIHIHVPAGAIPKDGPSAGVCIFVALVSLFSGRPVKSTAAFTGEITLRGNVLPVGGIKEKVLAARRAGIRHIILPAQNSYDLQRLSAQDRKGVRFHLITRANEAVAIAFGTRR